jgi:hypothetical protein
MERLSAAFGLTAVGLFGLALTVFATLNPSFHPLDDYVSKLGALGQPYAPWWNVIGFLIVGALLAGFGLSFGRVVDDRLVGGLLAGFGVGFGATGIPVDWAHQQAPVSKAHVVAICLGACADAADPSPGVRRGVRVGGVHVDRVAARPDATIRRGATAKRPG